MTIRVFGTPVSQGSKRALINKHTGRAVMMESNKNLRPWRESVKFAAMEVGEMVKGPIEIEFIFTLRKPVSAPKGKRTWPDKKPDLSKLIRSTEDALVESGAIEDDARIVRCLAMKVFPGEHPDSLIVPGVLIRITSADSQQPLISRLA